MLLGVLLAAAVDENKNAAAEIAVGGGVIQTPLDIFGMEKHD